MAKQQPPEEKKVDDREKTTSGFVALIWSYGIKIAAAFAGEFLALADQWWFNVLPVPNDLRVCTTVFSLILCVVAAVVVLVAHRNPDSDRARQLLSRCVAGGLLLSIFGAALFL